MPTLQGRKHNRLNTTCALPAGAQTSRAHCTDVSLAPHGAARPPRAACQLMRDSSRQHSPATRPACNQDTSRLLCLWCLAVGAQAWEGERVGQATAGADRRRAVSWCGRPSQDAAGVV
jgi:hypothetical protein